MMRIMLRVQHNKPPGLKFEVGRLDCFAVLAVMRSVLYFKLAK